MSSISSTSRLAITFGIGSTTRSTSLRASSTNHPNGTHVPRRNRKRRHSLFIHHDHRYSSLLIASNAPWFHSGSSPILGSSDACCRLLLVLQFRLALERSARTAQSLPRARNEEESISWILCALWSSVSSPFRPRHRRDQVLESCHLLTPTNGSHQLSATLSPTPGAVPWQSDCIDSNMNRIATANKRSGRSSCSYFHAAVLRKNCRVVCLNGCADPQRQLRTVGT